MPRARARRRDPSTSHAAARSVGDLTPNQTAVLTVFKIFGPPMLDEELIAGYKLYRKAFALPQQSESGIRSRRAELAEAGKLVEDRRKKMSTGRMGRTWRLPENETARHEGLAESLT